MKKLLFLLLPFFVQSQILDVVEKGYYQTFVNDSFISNHIKRSKADAKILELKILYPSDSVYVKQPNVEPDINVDELIYLVNYNYNYVDPGMTIYYGNKGDVQDVVLSDFDLFDVTVTDKYMNNVSNCKQGEIKDVSNIESYDYFFVRYKSEAFKDVVRKMKVVDGELKNY